MREEKAENERMTSLKTHNTTRQDTIQYNPHNAEDNKCRKAACNCLKRKGKLGAARAEVSRKAHRIWWIWWIW